jgi:hypothetical protein
MGTTAAFPAWGRLAARRASSLALVPHAVFPPNQEQPFVTRLFDESCTLDEYLITRPDFSDHTLKVNTSALHEGVRKSGATIAE